MFISFMGWWHSDAVEESANNYSRRDMLRSLVVAGGVVSGTAGLTGIASAEQVSRSKSKPFTQDGASVQFGFSNLPAPTSDIEVTVRITGDYGHETEYADIYVEGGLVGTIDVTAENIDCNTFSGTFTTNRSNITEGEMGVIVDNSENVTADICEGNQIEVTISYLSNRPPTASFTVSGHAVKRFSSLTFDASASADPNGSIVRYEWDFDGDGVFEKKTSSPLVTHRFTDSLGTTDVTLRVTDGNGATATATDTIRVLHTWLESEPPDKKRDGGPGGARWAGRG
ncbi:MAG: PKD domain-containing protein, partial [Haloarculaceae archaeon]